VRRVVCELRRCQGRGMCVCEDTDLRIGVFMLVWRILGSVRIRSVGKKACIRACVCILVCARARTIVCVYAYVCVCAEEGGGIA
jgi:hypothetical protein